MQPSSCTSSSPSSSLAGISRENDKPKKSSAALSPSAPSDPDTSSSSIPVNLLPPVFFAVLAASCGTRLTLVVAGIAAVVYQWHHNVDAEKIKKMSKLFETSFSSKDPRLDTIRASLDYLRDNIDDASACLRALSALTSFARSRAARNHHDSVAEERTPVPTEEECEEMQRLAMGVLACHHPTPDVHPDDAVCGAAFALLTMLLQIGDSGENSLRTRALDEPDDLGPGRIVAVLRSSLRRQREAEVEDGEGGGEVDDRFKERQCAALVRQGYILLGSLADGFPPLAKAVADAGIIDVALEGAAWFPGHLGVVNWSLWGAFTVVHEAGKEAAAKFLRDSDGMGKVASIMTAARAEALDRGQYGQAGRTRKVTDAVGAQRHGEALLYEILKAAVELGPGRAITVARLAKSSGVVEAVRGALIMCYDVEDVRLMGEQILIFLNEEGKIPPRAACE